MVEGSVKEIWGEALSFLERPRRLAGMDLLILAGFAGLVFSFVDVTREWTAPTHVAAVIDLSPWALPRYTLFSLSRGLLAYSLSLGFTLVYGYWAAKDRLAEKVLAPLLDVLQSIPVLGFMPGLVLGLVALFPKTNVGLELAAVIMIFTAQAWNMTFSFYQSLRSVPLDMLEASQIYRFSWWERLKWVELPFSAIGLVWNSMMSMAGGWFFLMINESFTLGTKDFRLPGIGSYMSAAAAAGDGKAMVWAVLAMVLMIVGLDRLLWRPVVVWSQRFRIEEGGQSEHQTSRVLEWFRRSRVIVRLRRLLRSLLPRAASAPKAPAPVPASAPPAAGSATWVSGLLFICMLAALSLGGFKLFWLMRKVPWTQWRDIVSAAGWTFGRVMAAVVCGTLWALPAGLAVGLSPRLSRAFQPVIQVAASFPAPMLFPAVVAALKVLGVPLGWGSILLMLLGTQWYILFNVIAGAMAVPSDMREAAREYRLPLWKRFRVLYLPAVFPYLLTGWVTAAGGAWNASIVSEYVSFKGEVLSAWGLGALISRAAEHADFPGLAASVLAMATVVVLFNNTVWRYAYRLAETRYSLNK